MAVWKKVIASGSIAQLAQVTASGLRILTLATDNNSLSPRIVTVDSGDLRAITQSDMTGVDTTYSVSPASTTGLSSTAAAGGFAFSFSYPHNHHDDFGTIAGTPNFTHSLQFALDHLDWTTTQGTTNLHASTYDNTIYSGVADRVLVTAQVASTVGGWPIYQVTSSTYQPDWNQLNSPFDGQIGSPASPANFQIHTTNLIDGSAVSATNISASNLSQTFAAFATLGNGDWSASTVNSLISADWDVNPSNNPADGLEIEGNFYFSGLEFMASLIDSHTGSHVWGSPTNFGVNGIDTQTTFLGDSSIIYGGVTASGTLYGDGTALTGLTSATNYDIATLTTGSGITSSGAPNTYDYLTANTFKIELDGAGITSGLKFLSGELKVPADGVTPAMVADGTVIAADLIGDVSNTGEITKAHLDHGLIATASALANADLAMVDDLMVFDLANPTAKHSITKLSQYVFNELTGSYTNDGGTVTGLSVAPLVGGSLINGLYLQLDSEDDSTQDGVGTIETITLKGTPAIGQGQWYTTSELAGSQLTIPKGGTGETGNSDLNAARAAGVALVTGVSQTGGELRIGGTSTATEATTISGSIQIDTSLTAIQSDHFETKDLHVLLGSGDAYDAAATFGLNFGRPATSSNSIIFDDTTSDDRLKFGYGYGIDGLEPSPAGIPNYPPGVSRYSMMGVCSGSTDAAGVSEAEHEGNMRIHDGEIYLYV